MAAETNRRIVLKRRPVGAPRPDDFELVEGKNFGKLLVKVGEDPTR